MKKNLIKSLAITMAISVIAMLTPNNNLAYAEGNDIIKKSLQSVKEQNLTEKLNTIKNIPIDILIDTESKEEISVIVKLKGDVIKESKENIKTKQGKFKEFINDKNSKKKDKKIKIKEEYSTVFNGISLNIYANEVESLLESNDVDSIWLDQQVTTEPVVNEYSPDNSDKKEQSNVDSVTQIEADKLHAKNITGKGIKVGVLDTGIDYNHPDLKDNFKGGYDCIDEDNDPMEATYEEWLASGKAEYRGASTYYTEHGTHVSGTIAGSGKSKLQQSVKGVAPEVDLYVYRVLGPYGSGYFSDAIQGVELAVQQGMDVINLSLGSAENNPYTPVADALNNAMLLGTTVVVAAGNTGSEEGSVGNPGSASFPISVGASSTYLTRTLYDIQIDKTKYELTSLAKDFSGSIDKLENNEFEVVYVDSGLEYNYKNLGLTKADIQGKVVLISQAWGNIQSELKIAKTYGAVGAIIYPKYSATLSGIYESKDIVPAFTINKEGGVKLFEQLKNTDVKITFENKQIVRNGKEELAYFSSRGPGYYEFDIKPDVVAPGVDVYSTVPVYIKDLDTLNYDNAYERMNGTSMAAPHVTGAVALLKQSNKKLNPFDIKKALMNTAEELDSKYAVNEIGSGRINVFDAVNTTTTISSQDTTKIYDGQTRTDINAFTGSLAFGKYSGDNGATVEKELTITNNLNKEKKYDVAIEFYSNYPASDVELNKVELKNVPAEIKINKKSSITIKPTIVVPADAEKGSYQGYIIVTDKVNKDEIYRIPFSINYSEEGIIELKHNREGISTKYGELFSPLLEAHMVLGSHMTEISIFAEDASGKIVGISAAANIATAPIKSWLRIGGFAGVVLPIDEEGNVGTEFTVLPEGDYNIVYYTKDALGREYKEKLGTWIDNTTPELSFNNKPGIYEVGTMPETFNISGTSFDAGIQHVMDIKGEDTYLDQSWSNVYYFEHNNFGNFNLFFPEANGAFNFDIYLDTEKDINKFGVPVIDIFGAGSFRERSDFFIIKEGTPYIYTTFDKRKVKKDEDFTMSVKMKNISNFKNGEFRVDYMDNHIVDEITLNQDFINYAESKGYEFELKTENNDEQYSIYDTRLVTIKALKEGTEPLVLDTEMNIFDVKLVAKGDYYYDSGNYEAYEECLIKEANINDGAFENILNTNLIYESAKMSF